MPWESTLQQVLDCSYAGLERAQIRWAVIGSPASALQGCRIVPRDIDILVMAPEYVRRFAEFMTSYTPPVCAHSTDEDDWHSSREYPVDAGPDDYGFVWHFARWYVDGFKVEVAHILPPEGFPTASSGAGIWEAGSEIWPHVKRIPFAGYQVPVVPLEIQLETNLTRGLRERVQAIITVFQERGYDPTLARRSLRSSHREAVEKLIQL